MSRETFLTDPWKTSHGAFEGAFFVMRPAPEFATAEVIVASTYRAIGFASHPERAVPSAGRDLDKAASKQKRHPGRVSPEAWKTVLHGALQSPKQPKQSSKRFLQLCPIVPDAALYSGSARLAGSSWNPGHLVARMISLGSPSVDAARATWVELFNALSITKDDDVWARWLAQEFKARRTVSIDWQVSPLSDVARFLQIDDAAISIPAQQLVQDLAAVIRVKGSMTRRQWVSILESVLRLGSVAHVLWLCAVHERLWRVVRSVLDGGTVPDQSSMVRTVFDKVDQPLGYGTTALPFIRDITSRYLQARLGLNLVLWTLEDGGSRVDRLTSTAEVHAFLQLLHDKGRSIDVSLLWSTFDRLCDTNARDLACRRGIGNNILEFCRHALGQRLTADDTLRGYDQGYQLRKKAEYATAPWVVSLGPVALLAFTHCCLLEASGPRSVLRLCEHLARYGIDVDRDDIAESDLGLKLRMLGLVLDSPDAESGMLLVPPFEPSKTNLTRQ
jgi:hypothetical protein